MMILDLHLVVTTDERGEDAWAAARRIDDTLAAFAGFMDVRRLIVVNTKTGRISIDTQDAAPRPGARSS